MKTQRAYPAMLIAAALVLPLSSAIADDTLRRALPAPELILRYHEALVLTEAQASTVQAAIATMNREFGALTPALEARSRELAAAVEDPTVAADEVQRRLDAVLETESRLKAARLRASLAARRAVTPEQWRKLTELRSASAPRDPATTAAEAVREDLQKKFQRVRELSGEVFPDGPPADLRRLFNEGQNKVRAGRLAEAESAFDQLIEAMEKRRAGKDKP